MNTVGACLGATLVVALLPRGERDESRKLKAERRNLKTDD
jgi:hypothetical protein